MGNFFRSNVESLEHSVVGRRASEAEIDCLMLIAEEVGGVQRFLQEASSVDAPKPALDDGMFPSSASMLESVRSFLKSQVGPALAKSGDKRASFIAHVAVNALGIVARSLTLGRQIQYDEILSLRSLLCVPEDSAENHSLQSLRECLVMEIRNGKISVDKPGLLSHMLRFTALQLTVDQPSYASLDMLRSQL